MILLSGEWMKSWEVEGHNYTPVGKINNLAIDWAQDQAFSVLGRCAAMCNESRLIVDTDEKFIRNGEPTEAAIRVLVEKMGCPDHEVMERCYQKPVRKPQ